MHAHSFPWTLIFSNFYIKYQQPMSATVLLCFTAFKAEGLLQHCNSLTCIELDDIIMIKISLVIVSCDIVCISVEGRSIWINDRKLNWSAWGFMQLILALSRPQLVINPRSICICSWLLATSTYQASISPQPPCSRNISCHC